VTRRVYFIEAGDGGPIKIGVSVDVAEAEAQLSAILQVRR
jgi:hypothetical protein